MNSTTTLPPPITIPSPTSAISSTPLFTPDFLQYAMIAVVAGVIIYVVYKLFFHKPNYRYWLRLIDGNEEREIPLTRIDEVNFVSVRGNIRVYKDPTVKMVKSGKRYIIYGWGIQPYYIAKDPQTLLNVGIRDLLLRIGNKEIKFDGTWKSIVDYYAYLIKSRIDMMREITLDTNTQLVIAVDYPSIFKNTMEDLLHTNVKHSLRQLEEILNIEKNIAVSKSADFSWMRWIVIALIVLGVFMLAITVMHK
ncbi:MAG: hypothetical protein JHC26_00630 [Thermofilum sp.]|uniref:hypothetical protein n=1 Tax=Thermofilum sp. TaxID=1961369 RepID=UPI00258A5FC5|nr:hypothetical protein [Thermofilum sp.]MCI4407571.1 hypothetical protein [Thermofilum sp.]